MEQYEMEVSTENVLVAIHLAVASKRGVSESVCIEGLHILLIWDAGKLQGLDWRVLLENLSPAEHSQPEERHGERKNNIRLSLGESKG
eukprot:CAMPEP_0117673306 /NCGR_PEP_ID=MMETSP0804-20121206/14399_1 /TAXON_ID=1074897 /ORGANISM="Tetraselmis astigmatica, Strain CCMP880" /LENGTH=87 /DNA_ID=CAMNT_0005482029 /DNA_START=579 /DNA_END=842 /DNA_ORIENTATION=+